MEEEPIGSEDLTRRVNEVNDETSFLQLSKDLEALKYGEFLFYANLGFKVSSMLDQPWLNDKGMPIFSKMGIVFYALRFSIGQANYLRWLLAKIPKDHFEDIPILISYTAKYGNLTSLNLLLEMFSLEKINTKCNLEQFLSTTFYALKQLILFSKDKALGEEWIDSASGFIIAVLKKIDSKYDWDHKMQLFEIIEAAIECKLIKVVSVMRRKREFRDYEGKVCDKLTKLPIEILEKNQDLLFLADDDFHDFFSTAYHDDNLESFKFFSHKLKLENYKGHTIENKIKERYAKFSKNEKLKPIAIGVAYIFCDVLSRRPPQILDYLSKFPEFIQCAIDEERIVKIKGKNYWLGNPCHF